MLCSCNKLYVGRHACNAYCDNDSHAEIARNMYPNDLPVTLEELQAAIKSQACCELTYALRILSFRPAPEASWGDGQDGEYYLYRFTFEEQIMREWKVGDIVSREGVDEQRILWIDQQGWRMEVVCIKEPAPSVADGSVWITRGETEGNLCRRYHLVRRGAHHAEGTKNTP